MAGGFNLLSVVEYINLYFVHADHVYYCPPHCLYIFCSCRFIEMDGEGFLTEILLNGDDGHVTGLDDINIPVTQETDFGTEVQQMCKCKCKELAVQREQRGQEILITRKMKSYAQDG
jgi:hypothetical protein